MVPTCYNEPARARVTNLQRICQPRELPPGSELLDFLPEILTLACKATGPGTAGSWDSSTWAVCRGDPQAVKQGFLLSESGPHHSLHVCEQLFSLRVSGGKLQLSWEANREDVVCCASTGSRLLLAGTWEGGMMVSLAQKKAAPHKAVFRP